MNLTRDAITLRLRALVVEQLGVDDVEITLDADLTNDLGADSLDTVELVMVAEDEFGIELDDDEIERVHTIKDAIDLIEQKVQAKV
jgi:acyl carrier protein